MKDYKKEGVSKNHAFTPEQLAAMKACKSVEELLACAQENGIALTEAEALDCLAQSQASVCELNDAQMKTFNGGGDFFTEIGDTFSGPIDCNICNNGERKSGVPTNTVTERRNAGHVHMKYVTHRCAKCGRQLYRDTYRNEVKVSREYY